MKIKSAMQLMMAAFAIIGSLLFVNAASADTFRANGGTITAVRNGDNVSIMVTGIPAVQLVHYRGQGKAGGYVSVSNMSGGRGVLKNVSKNGSRFQLKDEGGRSLFIKPAGNRFKLVGVVQECRKSRRGCALEAR